MRRAILDQIRKLAAQVREPDHPCVDPVAQLLLRTYYDSRGYGHVERFWPMIRAARALEAALAAGEPIDYERFPWAQEDRDDDSPAARDADARRAAYWQNDAAVNPPTLDERGRIGRFMNQLKIKAEYFTDTERHHLRSAGFLRR